MSATNAVQKPNAKISYAEYCWGEGIHGTKEDLQALGLGVGMAFPGEAGGRKKEMNIRDPRGFKCRIKHNGGDAYWATIYVPEREMPDALGGWKRFADGVQRKASVWVDHFVGTSEALVAAGLVPAGCFPGMPGMRKTSVRILPDGSLLSTAPTTKHPDSNQAGAKVVTQLSPMKYQVSLYVDEELGNLRNEADTKARHDWQVAMDNLPRPERLDGNPSTRQKAASLDTRPKTPADWKRFQKMTFDVLRATVEDAPFLGELNSRFQYDQASRMNILAKLDELERAINAGTVLHKAPQGPANDGNVVSLHSA